MMPLWAAVAVVLAAQAATVAVAALAWWRRAPQAPAPAQAPAPDPDPREWVTATLDRGVTGNQIPQGTLVVHGWRGSPTRVRLNAAPLQVRHRDPVVFTTTDVETGAAWDLMPVWSRDRDPRTYTATPARVGG